jgi:hypothetical protein
MEILNYWSLRGETLEPISGGQKGDYICGKTGHQFSVLTVFTVQSMNHEEGTVTICDGTTYRLGEMSPGYKQWSTTYGR